MKIIEFSASNFKRLRAVDITPNGHMVEIKGKNGQGKSSVLDAIEAIFAGALPKRPVRDGAERSVLRASVGEEAVEYILTRRISAAGGNPPLIIEAPSGARYQRPQEFVDRLIGAISFDPMEFARQKPKAQFEELRKIVTLDVDADALDGQNKRDFETRTEINRDAARARGQAAGIQVSADLPQQPIDTAALIAEMQAAGEHNRALDRAATARQQSDEIIAADLRKAIELENQAAELLREAERLRKRAKDGRETLAAAPAPAEAIDTAALAETLRKAQATNSMVTDRDRRAILEAEATTLEKRATALTEAMDARSLAKAEALARAVFPVPGLAFGDGEILYQGVPFEQASQAEKIRVSVGVAIAANPKLRVLCVRDGSLLDSDSKKLLSELVTAADYQCWFEVTEDDGEIGIIIEDGAVRGAPPPATESPVAAVQTSPEAQPAAPLPAAPEGKTVRRARPKPGGLL
jgi:hypothetical protein